MIRQNRKNIYAGKYEIIIEKHVRKEPDQLSDYTEILQPGDIIDVEDMVKGWLKLKSGGYVCWGHGRYARKIKTVSDNEK